jgi:hypothetical protein
MNLHTGGDRASAIGKLEHGIEQQKVFHILPRTNLFSPLP